MKNKRILLFVVSSLFVVSCSGSNTLSSSEPTSEASSIPSISMTSTPESSSGDISTSSSSAPEKRMEEKTINVYRLFNRDNDYLDPDISDSKYQLGTVTFSFVKGQEFIPYITLENLSKLYSKFYVDKATTTNTLSVSEGKHTWSINSGDKRVFTSTIDINEETFSYSGDLEKIIETKKDHSKYSFMLRMKYENKVLELPSTRPAVIDFSDTEFEIIEEDGKVYFPFSMLHTFYHEQLGHDFFYNYSCLYEYNEVDDISKAAVTNGDDVYTPLEQMRTYIDEHVKEKDESEKPLMPMYLRVFHRAEFALTFNHYYGLKNTWGVSNMIDFFDNYGIYEDLIHENSAIRGAAYSKAFFMLSDNHTGRIILGDDPWSETNGNAVIPGGVRSDLTTERSLVSNALTAQRDKFLKANGFEDGIKDAIIYSEDGKTAYFGFDSFDATSNAYKSDGTVKSDEELAKSDTYFYFVKILKEIKAHEKIVEDKTVKVENVIIDDSLNGGGYLSIMGRLLALISKDNSAYATTLNDITNIVNKGTYHVDTNNDGKYDEKDCFGNDFKFYILTSPLSFSCGNAFPFLASTQFNHVKVFGVKSGGGECVVGQNYFSNGMGFVHSSTEHLIIFNEAKLTYDSVEHGVDVNGTLKYNDFYNMEEMIKCISKIA